jgi:hypothetical protein
VRNTSRAETAVAELKTVSLPLPILPPSQSGKKKLRMLTEKMVFAKS